MKKKIFSILAALVLASMLVPAVVSANPALGDVTVIVQDQAGAPIEGAQASLFFTTGPHGYADWMNWQTTDSSGTTTFSATDILTWLGGSVPANTKFQVGAKYSGDSYGTVHTYAVSDELPCIAYDAGKEYTFTYKLVFVEGAATVTSDDSTYTITYSLTEAVTETLTAKMGFFHGPLAGHSTPIFKGYFIGGAWQFYDMIDTNGDAQITSDDYVAATVSGSSLSVPVAKSLFAGITDTVIAVPVLIKNPVTHAGLTDPEKSAAMDMYGISSSSTLPLMIILSGGAVSMTAASEEAIIGISVSPTSINFGAVTSGATVAGPALIVSNIGNVGILVDADITADTFFNDADRLYFYTAALRLQGGPSDKVGAPTSFGAWVHQNLFGSNPIEVTGSRSLTTGLQCPPEIKAATTYTGTVVFWAEQP